MRFTSPATDRHAGLPAPHGPSRSKGRSAGSARRGEALVASEVKNESSLIRPKAITAALAAAGVLLCLTACGGDASDQARAGTEPVLEASSLELTSEQACLVDADCAAGSFCFQRRCAWQCDDEHPCSEGAVCSPRGRCVVEQMPVAGDDLGFFEEEFPTDEERLAEVPTEERGFVVLEPPQPEVEVLPGQAFVEVSIELAEPLPSGRVSYRYDLEGEERSAARMLVAEGERVFTFVLPTGRAGDLDSEPEVQRVFLVTSLGGYTVTLVPRIPVTGFYAGEVSMREFGGSAIPTRFGLRVEPPDASFDEATERFLLLPATRQDVFAPAVTTGEDDSWYEVPLHWDEVADVWFARVSSFYEFGSESAWRRSGDVVRALRIEIGSVENSQVIGALSDRWLGLFDERTADGVVVPGSVLMAGSLTAHRSGPLPDAADEPRPVVDVPLESVGVGMLIPITECGGDVLSRLVAGAAPPPGEHDEPGDGSFACEGVSGPADFTSLSGARRARCALALADEALKGETTASQILAFLDPKVENPEGLSFVAFLELCAAQDGFCVPSPEVLCATNLLAHAYQSQGEELPQAGDLLDRYQNAAREAYLGSQLAAFQVDTNIRLDWLRTQIAPLFLASALRAYNEDILRRWRDQVLDAHFEILDQQFAPAGLEVLARSPTDPLAMSVRRQMLLEMAQTWQGAMESLQIAADRWNSLYQNDVKRAESAGLVRSRMFDLYLSAAMLAQLGRSSGSSATNASFGAGFAAVLRSLESLSLPFNDLMFMRDAEVVVSRSVDPSSDSRTLLGELEELARRAVADAQSSVDLVLEEAREEELNAQILTGRMQAQAEELSSELVALCGLPTGCTVEDITGHPDCRVRTAPGWCGFLVDPESGVADGFEFESGTQNISEAGKALLGYREALLSLQIAQEEYRAHNEQVSIEYANAAAFKESIDRWAARRRAVREEVEALGDEMSRLEAMVDSAELQTIKAAQRERELAYARQERSVQRWSEIRYEGVTSDMELMQAAHDYKKAAAWLTWSAERTDELAKVLSDGLPKNVGTSIDPSWKGRMTIGIIAFAASTGLGVGALVEEANARAQERAMAEEKARREAEIEELKDLSKLSKELSELRLEQLAGDLRAIKLRTEAEISTREAMIDALRRNLELDLAHDRELVELRDRRDRVRSRLADSPRLLAQIHRVEVVAAQRLMEYMQIVQRAQLLEGRHEAVVERLDNLHILLGSPSVIFAFANRLARAEARIDRAKRRLYDWLVALEYYAVRPFLDQRLAILLARNPSQLEAIAEELLRLERVCGGLVNYQSADLSMRDDLMQLGFDLAATESRPAPADRAQRFREVLARGNVPVDRRVRYSSDERIGNVIESRDVLAASFEVRLEDFANLPVTCNAKVASVGVTLQGDGLGSGRPVVSLLYDGSSRLRSCQPNIADIVASLNPGTTAFNRVTEFRTQGRSVSPIAAISGDGRVPSTNRGLEGLPLASTWTVLIDPEAGENSGIDWGALEDITFHIEYVYQDLFPEGQCE